MAPPDHPQALQRRVLIHRLEKARPADNHVSLAPGGDGQPRMSGCGLRSGLHTQPGAAYEDRSCAVEQFRFWRDQRLPDFQTLCGIVIEVCVIPLPNGRGSDWSFSAANRRAAGRGAVFNLTNSPKM